MRAVGLARPRIIRVHRLGRGCSTQLTAGHAAARTTLARTTMPSVGTGLATARRLVRLRLLACALCAAHIFVHAAIFGGHGVPARGAAVLAGQGCTLGSWLVLFALCHGVLFWFSPTACAVGYSLAGKTLPRTRSPCSSAVGRGFAAETSKTIPAAPCGRHATERDTYCGSSALWPGTLLPFYSLLPIARIHHTHDPNRY